MLQSVQFACLGSCLGQLATSALSGYRILQSFVVELVELLVARQLVKSACKVMTVLEGEQT
jgi:hypothetical protein